MFAEVAKQAPIRNRPFRELFQENYGWSDHEIDDYIDDRNATLKQGASIRVRYLGTEQERRPYEVTGGGSLTWGWRTPPATVDTGALFAKEEGAGYGIYVMDASGRIYLGSHHIALFHHSSFLAAAGAAAAGGIMIRGGVVEHLTNHSGHYTPGTKHVLNVIGELLDRGHPLRRDVVITDEAAKKPGDVSLEAFLRANKPEWLPRIGVNP